MNHLPHRGKPLTPQRSLFLRTRRGPIGQHWWARRVAAALESTRDDTRLNKGKAYARKGQVLAMDLSPYILHAKVKGSHPRPYEVTLRFEPLSEQQWDGIARSLRARTDLYTALRVGALPVAIEEAFLAHEAWLFPHFQGDVNFRCTCPDHGDPCKHAAAAFYLLIERLDDKPLDLLLWRGRSAQALLPETQQAPDLDLEALSPHDLSQFWGHPRPPLDLSATLEPGDPTALLQSKGPTGLKLSARDLQQHLTPLYQQLSAQALALAADPAAWHEIRHQVFPPREATVTRPDPSLMDPDEIVEELDEAYDHLDEAALEELFGAWCASFPSFELEGEWIDMSRLWTVKEGLFDLLADESPDTLRIWLRRARKMLP